MLNGDLFSVTIFTERSWRGRLEGISTLPTSKNRSAGQCQAIPTDRETQPYPVLGKLSRELCAANARRGDTAPKAGLLLSSDIETE